MNAKEARKILSNPTLDKMSECREALRLAVTALRHEEKMERIADLEATPEKVTLTLEDILYINNEAQVFERLLHHLPDDIVDHIEFICRCEMTDRQETGKHKKPAEGTDWEQIEKECEA